MDTIKIVGFISAILTTSAFFPQALKTWKTRSTEDLSPLMFSLFFMGIVGWLLYGIFIKDLPMILANAITIVLAGSIMFFILKGDRAKKVHHIGIYVKDLDNIVNFYKYWFDCEVGELYVNPQKSFSSRFLSFTGGAKIEFMHIPDSSAEIFQHNKTSHIAISVGGNKKVDYFSDSLKVKGIEILDGPRTTGDGYYELTFMDPEGNKIEITS